MTERLGFVWEVWLLMGVCLMSWNLRLRWKGGYLVLNGLFHCVHVLSVFYLCEYRLLKCETGVGLTFLMRSL